MGALRGPGQRGLGLGRRCPVQRGFGTVIRHHRFATFEVALQVGGVTGASFIGPLVARVRASAALRACCFGARLAAVAVAPVTP